MGKMFSKLFKHTNTVVLKGKDLQEKIDVLHLNYMPLDLNPAFNHNKLRSIKKLDFILQNSSRTDLQASVYGEVLVCALTVVYYFGMRLKLNKGTSKYGYWFEKRQFLKAEAAFQHTMVLLNPECSEATTKITLQFFTAVALWPFESFVGQILEVILYLNRGKMTLFNLLLTDMHYILFKDVTSARHRMRVLYGLLNSDNWILDKQTLLPFITRLLDYFAYSLNNGARGGYKYLRKGFEVCLRRIFERADNRDRLTIITTVLNWFSMVSMTDDDVLQFSPLLDRAAELYQVGTYGDSLNEGLINYILKNFVGSSNALYSLIGCRLLQRFLDRKSNGSFFEVPAIYYEFSQVRLRLGTYDSGDKMFIAQHREKFHQYFINAVKKHCHSLVNLKALYSVICCLLMEVPCGLTAAASACIAMCIQDFAINGQNLSVACRYWMHAIVISVMSLICWVHKASVLYCYVNEIVARRAKESPQLNPPLLTVYCIRSHHVIWNKPTLFFEDWELRYGLWKHFKDSQLSQAEAIVGSQRRYLPWI